MYIEYVRKCINNKKTMGLLFWMNSVPQTFCDHSLRIRTMRQAVNKSTTEQGTTAGVHNDYSSVFLEQICNVSVDKYMVELENQKYSSNNVILQ